MCLPSFFLFVSFLWLFLLCVSHAMVGKCWVASVQSRRSDTFGRCETTESCRSKTSLLLFFLRRARTRRPFSTALPDICFSRRGELSAPKQIYSFSLFHNFGTAELWMTVTFCFSWTGPAAALQPPPPPLGGTFKNRNTVMVWVSGSDVTIQPDWRQEKPADDWSFYKVNSSLICGERWGLTRRRPALPPRALAW